MNRHLAVNWVRVARLSLFALTVTGVVLVGFIAYGSWLYAYYFTHPGCAGARESLQDQGYSSEAVDFDTPRGYQLRGWLTRGERYPDIAIIVLTGASGNTQFALPDAALLAKAGYGTLVYEHRSCADPALLHSGGYLEADDLVSAAQYLRTRPDIHHVGVLGFSTGGTTALLGTAKEPGIEAVIAMGGFSSLEDDALSAQDVHSPLDWFVRRLVVAFVNFQVGVASGEISPAAQVGQISPRPLLLIYGEYEADHGEILYAAAGEPKELWIVPGVGHGGYQGAAPEEYETRIVGFFQTVFDQTP